MAPGSDSPLQQEPAAQPWLGAESPAGLWPALLAGLVAALLAWVWYGGSGGRGADAGGPDPASPGPELLPGAARGEDGPGPAEHHLESSKTDLLETKAGVPCSPGELVGSVTATMKEEGKAPSGAFSPETEPLLKEEHAPSLINTAEHLHEIFGYSSADLGLQKGPESNVWGVDTLASVSPSSAGQEDQRGQIAECQDSVDHEEWEVIPEHSVWGDASKNSSTDESGIAVSREGKELEPVDCLDGDAKAKRVAAVPPMPQNIHVTFRVHYITHSEGQLIAVTGDHECLGQWHSYLPLKGDKDGFWSDSVVLPVDTRIEWKFILVEDGKVRRWEECDNRVLVTEHEDRIAHQWWGYH